ncbi:hypothetical protein ACJJTC_011622 [Scirpophaga incertulas]
MCVPISECKRELEALECRINEEEKCVKPCPPERTCRHRVNNVFCKRDNNPCQRKCVCQPGYYRNSIGQCISEAQCDQCSKPNEFFSCGSACDNECSTLNEQNRTNCPIINVRCNERCYCDDGYARDDSGMCVPVSECPKCGFNEVYRTVAICPPMPTCDNTYEDYNCPDIDPMPTESKCICKVGYLRNSKGVCVPEEQCENRRKYLYTLLIVLLIESDEAL